jgi:hypothetical protein
MSPLICYEQFCSNFFGTWLCGIFSFTVDEGENAYIAGMPDDE